MARIRSVHPGLFTDEDFVALTDAAQIFFIGLMTEADDQGIFEWKPVTLRMRLRAAKDGSIDGLLAELVAVNKVGTYEIAGRKYGAIRNFRKFQRPKSPNALYPTTPEWRNYVGLSEPISEMPRDEPPPFPPKGEIPPQMEDGGGRGGEDGKKDPRWRGKVIRLNEADYTGWGRAYSSIPDLDAELTRIDDALASDGKTKGWFPAASAMLAAKHQKNLDRRKLGSDGRLRKDNGMG